MIKRQRQTIQWSKDKDKQYNDQKTKTNNTMIKRQRQTIQWSKDKDKQYNGQKTKTNNNLQHITKTNKQRATWSH
jgi:hypothetical protein